MKRRQMSKGSADKGENARLGDEYAMLRDENTRLRDEIARLKDLAETRLEKSRVEDIREIASLREQVDKLLNIVIAHCKKLLAAEKMTFHQTKCDN